MPYTADVDEVDAGKLAEIGVDLGHSGYDAGKSYAQQVKVVLYPSQAKKLEARGVELNEVEIAAPEASKEERQAAAGGDSPNPYPRHAAPGDTVDVTILAGAAAPGARGARPGGRVDVPDGRRVALSTADTVTFGFGLEQVPAATRNELVARALAHLLPAAADTTAPAPVAFKYPTADGYLATPRDPVEVDVTAADERGDMKEVRLRADGKHVGTHRTFPFQFRYTPSAADVGNTVTLVAEAEDKAGNVATATRTVSVVAPPKSDESPRPGDGG